MWDIFNKSIHYDLLDFSEKMRENRKKPFSTESTRCRCRCKLMNPPEKYTEE